jgi:hypothetical protein
MCIFVISYFDCYYFNYFFNFPHTIDLSHFHNILPTMASSPHPLPYNSFVLLTGGAYALSTGRFVGYYGGPTPQDIAPQSSVWIPDVGVVIVATPHMQLIAVTPRPDDPNNDRIGILLCRRVGSKSTGGMSPRKQMAINNLRAFFHHYASSSSDDDSSSSS